MTNLGPNIEGLEKEATVDSRLWCILIQVQTLESRERQLNLKTKNHFRKKIEKLVSQGMTTVCLKNVVTII